MKIALLLLFVFTVGCSRREHKIIQNKGSDTIVNLAQAWAEEYKKIKPDVAIAVSGGGSGTGIAALINGTVEIANSSRAMKEEEKAQALKNSGKPVNEFIVGLDALAVFVHPANPLTGLSIEEIACIYGDGGKCELWSDVRAGTVVPGCKDNKIIRVSRQSNSGTYQYFREAVLGEGKDFKQGSMDLNGSREAIDLVEKTPCAIGYSGMGYMTKHVKSLCVSKAGGDCVLPTLETATNRTYPIARELYMYTSGEPSLEVKAYMDWTQSDAAKEIIIKSGYVPVPKK
jgi:phosphate transport system substrate-binding protein